jgi:hypothetical protein
MTETDTIEQRLRRTFQAVADQPVAAPGLAPRPGRRHPASSRPTALLIAAVVVLVLGVGAVALVYGPRSAGPGSPTSPAATGSRDRFTATFATTRRASTRQIAEDAKIVSRRLAYYGYGTDSAVVRGRSVVIRGSRRPSMPISVLASSGTVLFRPVLCMSAPFTEPASAAIGGAVPNGCSPEYSLQAGRLIVGTATGTSNVASIPIDPILAAVPTSTPAYDVSHPDRSVLVPLVGGGGQRDLLGPAGLSGLAVTGAMITHISSRTSSQWIVDADLTDNGSVRWDALARKNFHEIIAVDVDGGVVTAPLIEPTQVQFTSFAGRIELSGNFNARSARALASVLNSGSLPTPLRLVTLTTLPPQNG